MHRPVNFLSSSGVMDNRLADTSRVYYPLEKTLKTALNVIDAHLVNLFTLACAFLKLPAFHRRLFPGWLLFRPRQRIDLTCFFVTQCTMNLRRRSPVANMHANAVTKNSNVRIRYRKSRRIIFIK